MADVYGFDTASYIYDVASSAKSRYGTPSFWIRYFKPTVTGGTPDQNFTTAGREMQSLRSSGAHYLAPISAPGSSRESTNSYSYGQSDAAVFAQSLQRFATYDPCTEYGVKIFSPTSTFLNVYLDVEASTVLNANYWNGWSTYIWNFTWTAGGNFAGAPLYPGIYCNPGVNSPCSRLSVNGFTTAVWSNQPEPCSACGVFGSVKWSTTSSPPKNCSGYTTYIWQQAEKGGCIGCGRCPSTTCPNVDIDELNPSHDSRSYMFYIDNCA